MEQNDDRIGRILILHPDAETRRSVDVSLRRVSGFPVTTYQADSLADGLSTAYRLDPQVILIGLTEERDLAFDIARSLRRPDRLIIGLYNPLVLREKTGRFFRQAARAGIGDFVPLPVADEELGGALAKVTEIRGQNAGPREGRMVSFISPKGGVGSTTLAVNAALVAAASDTVAGDVALCDAAVQFGNAAAHLGLAPDRDLSDLVSDLDDLGALSTYLVRHEETGLFILPSPRDFHKATRISPEDLSRTLIALRRRFELVIVDCPPALDLLTLAVLDLSELILVVTEAITPTVLLTARFLDLLEEEGLARDRTRVILNRQNAFKGALPGRTVNEELGRPVDHVLAFEPAVMAAVNQGTPLVLGRQNADFPRAIARLAADLAAPDGGDAVAPGDRVR